LEVNYDELHKLHPDMPPAAKDLKVFVIGAFGNGCAGNHAVWLEKAGYDVKMHWPALLNSSIDSIAFIIYKEHEKLLKRP
jgi:CheY-specific phosphatase CheX